MRLNQVMILQHPFYALLFCHNDSAIIRNADHVFYSGLPSLIIGSMVKIIPGTRSISLPFGVT